MITKLGFKKLENHSIVWCKTRFDILKHFGANHECDKRTDRQNRC